MNKTIKIKRTAWNGKTGILLLTVLLLQLNTFRIKAQDISDNLNFLKENTVTVQDKKTEYRQSFSYDPDNPMLITISSIESRKGEETIRSVNALDLNPFLVKFKPGRELVEITAGTNGGKDLVKVIEDGEVQNYDDELAFYASGIEEARSLTEALKAVAEYAKENAKPLLAVSNDKQTLLNEIKNAVKEVQINDDVYVQKFDFDAENDNLVNFTLSNAAGDEVEQFSVNLADLNQHKIAFETNRKEVVIPIVTKGERDLIAYTENGEAGNYTNDFSLKAASIEEARRLEAQLKALIEIAGKEETTDFSTFSFDQCVNLLKSQISEVVINQDAYMQQFDQNAENDLVFVYTIQDVSEDEKYEYVANAADFGKVPAIFNTRGNGVFVELKTVGNRDLIKVTQNDEEVDYDHEMKIRCPNIESARELAGTFTRFNQLAAERMETSVAFVSVPEAEKFVLSAINPVVVETDTYEQSLEKGSGDCLFVYHLTDVSSDKQHDFEFNLKDIDVNKIHFETRKSEAMIVLPTKGGNKLIQEFENGEADNFSNELQMKAVDLEQARKLEAAFKMLTKSCAEN